MSKWIFRVSEDKKRKKYKRNNYINYFKRFEKRIPERFLISKFEKYSVVQQIETIHKF